HLGPEANPPRSDVVESSVSESGNDPKGGSMRFAVVCYPTYGGSGVVATELAKALAEREHDVHTVSYERPLRVDESQEHPYFHQVEASDYPLFKHQPYSLNLANKLIELVEDHGVDVIHSHYAIPHAQAAWMAREVLREERGLDVKLACTLHGTDISLFGMEPSFYELTRFALQRQDLLTAPSCWLVGKTESEYRFQPERILAIPNFVDLERFHPADGTETRRELGAEDRYLITHMSNFRPVKRVADVISGFATFRKHADAVLALVGDGPDLAPAMVQAEELGIRDDVRVLGQRDDLETILQASDVFCLPSVAESFGLSALEAQACGCPVIGYHAGGLPEVVIDQQTGILCPEKEHVCLGSLTADLLADRERYQAMREASRRNAERFAKGPVVDRYEKALCCLVHSDRVCGAETMADCAHAPQETHA
ncbi:MAG: N-acetyl-alpha-D-glucosaminyl L-malate synthase BshA, partial [bacterium]|nr:N-acetyl-alpha-D-glucosaminyl L-malate synthase BshA [bacterium]